MHVEKFWKFTLKRKTVNLHRSIGDNPVMAISLLPYLIPDARSKPEIEKILQLSHVSVSSQFKAALHVWM